MIVFIRKKIKFLTFAAAFIILSAFAVLYANGDIFIDGWNLLPTGGIYVSGMPSGSEVFLNSKPKDETSFFQRNVLVKNLRPGSYKVDVEKDGYNSWTGTIKVSANLVSEADVFILPVKPELQEIPVYVSTTSKQKNQEYLDLTAAFASSTQAVQKKISSSTAIDFESNLGTKNSPVMNGNLGIWSDNGHISISWFGSEDSEPNYFCDQTDCKESLPVYILNSDPSRMDFFPDRNDVVLAAWGGDVFAVQAEANNEKAAQFLYHGIKPDFRIIDGSIYIKDGKYLAEVMLE